MCRLGYPSWFYNQGPVEGERRAGREAVFVSIVCRGGQHAIVHDDIIQRKEVLFGAMSALFRIGLPVGDVGACCFGGALCCMYHEVVMVAKQSC